MYIEENLKQSFISVSLINRGLEKIDLHSTYMKITIEILMEYAYIFIKEGYLYLSFIIFIYLLF